MSQSNCDHKWLICVGFPDVTDREVCIKCSAVRVVPSSTPTDEIVKNIIVKCNACGDIIPSGEKHECIYRLNETSEDASFTSDEGYLLVALRKKDKDQLYRIEQKLNALVTAAGVWGKVWE